MHKQGVIIILIILNLFMTSVSFAKDTALKDSLKLTDEEIDFLESKDTFYYAIESNYAPIEYIDSEGNPRGFGVEYLKKASEILNVNFIPVEGFKKYTWADCLNALKSGKIDLLSAVTNTEERREYISFTQPYLKANIIVIGNNDNKLILDIDDMEGATFVFPKKYWQNDYVRSTLTDYTLLNTTDTLESLEVINNMKGQYIFLESVVYNYYSHMKDFHNLRIVGELKFEASHCIGVSKDNELLRDILDKVIKNIPKNEVFKNAMMVEHKQENNYFISFISLIMIIIVIIIVFLRKTIIHNNYKRQMKKNRQTLIENLSHDLKTPLSVLKVNTALLKKGILDEKEQKSCLKVLDNSIDSLDSIIEDLYAVAHLKDILIEKKFISINISKFLKDVYNQHKDIFSKQNKRLEYIEDCNHRDARVSMDRNSMYRAISNLLSNALKFTDEFDSTILEYKVESNKVTIIVKDTGKGIDKESLEHVFERFYQGDNQSKALGKGLGLSITKEIVRMHNGRITVKSKKGEYTILKIILPTINKK